MAIDTQHTNADAAQDSPPSPRSRGRCRAIGTFFAAAARIFWSLLGRAGAKSKTAPNVPVVHDEVTLTPEGAEIWQQAMDPKVPFGKPANHQRRRLPSGDTNS